MSKCKKCKRTLANSIYLIFDKDGNKIKLCPICVLGEKEGSQSKYWEKSLIPKPKGFRYKDDTAKYKDKWDNKKQKWVPI